MDGLFREPMVGNALVEGMASFWIEGVGSGAVCSEAPRMPLLNHSYTEKTRAGANSGKFPLISARTRISSQSRRQLRQTTRRQQQPQSAIVINDKQRGLLESETGPESFAGTR